MEKKEPQPRTPRHEVGIQHKEKEKKRIDLPIARRESEEVARWQIPQEDKDKTKRKALLDQRMGREKRGE